MANQSLAELRQQVLQRQRAAGKKVSRLRGKGVNVAGTQYDPRRESAKIQRYNRTQLQAQLNRLNQFTSRGTQFVGDMRGRPVPAETWNRYKRQEQAFTSRVESEFQRFADIFLPNGESLTERLARNETKHRRMANPAVNVPYAPPDRKPKNMKNLKSLQKLTQDMKKKNSRRWFDKQVSAGRMEAGAMLGAIHAPDKLVANVDKLTKDQFYLLWNFTPFATLISSSYEAVQASLDGGGDFNENVMAGTTKEAGVWVEWAGSKKVRR